MKKKLMYFATILFSIGVAGYIGFSATSGRYDLLNVYLSGILLGLSIGALKLTLKNEKIDSYKRELEKESISAGENSSKVKVLEQKIEVLEKALDEALKK